MKKPEILSPIQDFTSLTAAIEAGADAVFFGVVGFNMRVTAKNFTVADIEEIVAQCRPKKVLVYLALNTIVYQDELGEVEKILTVAKEKGVHAVICWDFAVIQIAKKVGLPFHVSTQASIANVASARFFHELGTTRIVLARECSLEQIQEIKKEVPVEIEVFIHGAMCVSISGRCFMSQFTTCHSANRGACRQPCRRNYMITDVEGEYSFEVGPNYVLSPKDVCTLPFLEELVLSGIDCFKIEGRNKSPEYVSQVTSVYREAVDFIWEHREHIGDSQVRKQLTLLKERHMKELERVFTRGFSDGFYMGKPLNEWTSAYGNVGTERKIFLGKVSKVYKKISVFEMKIETNEVLSVGDEVYVQGEKTGVIRATVLSMEIEHTLVEQVRQGDSVALRIVGTAQEGDMVSRIEKVEE